MSQPDLDVLLDMGFDKARAEIAIKKPGGLQGALEWLEKNQDKSLEDVQADEAEDSEVQANIAALESGDGGIEGMQAKSLVCNECGKQFRNEALAQYHASKTEHTDFSESTVEIAPLTEEQKKAKLEELREKAAAKKAGKAMQEQEEAKRNEQIRLKATKEAQDLKEELQRKEQIKEAQRKRQEKADDVEAKRRIMAKIAADKEERRHKAEVAKAAREGRPAPAAASEPEPETPAAPAASASASAPAAAAADVHAQARLRLQTPAGNIMKTFPADTTLFEVVQLVEAETGTKVSKLSTTFPRKTFSGAADMGQTLKEAGLTPSAAIVVE